jgi:hypothetical protein
MNAWTYTAAERKTIDAAFSAVAYVVDHMGHNQPCTLRDALRHERRERKSTTVAKALLVAGFARGRKHNPRAADLAWLSAGIISATILGADSKRLERPADVLAGLAEKIKAAAAAHDCYMARGLAASATTREQVSTQGMA